MNLFNTILKLLTALATLAGIIYILATYGEQIVAWAKKMLASLPKCPSCEDASAVDFEEEITPVEEPAAEEAAEEAPAEEVAAEEVPVEEPAAEVVTENGPIAEEADFAE